MKGTRVASFESVGESSFQASASILQILFWLVSFLHQDYSPCAIWGSEDMLSVMHGFQEMQLTTTAAKICRDAVIINSFKKKSSSGRNKIRKSSVSINNVFLLNDGR